MTDKPFAFGLPPEWVGVSLKDQLFLAHLYQTRRYLLAIEFGTSNGVTAYMLGCMAQLILGARVVTIDKWDGRAEPFRSLPNHTTFLLGDIVDGGINSNIVDLLQRAPMPSLLICDNGNKPMEVTWYAPYLPRGCTIAVHDWSDDPTAGEIGPDRLTLPGDFVPFEHEAAVEMGSVFRAWERQ